MGVRGKQIGNEVKGMYLRLRRSGFSDRHCSMVLGVNPRTWRRIAERDAEFARDRDSAIRLGIGELLEVCQNWMVKAMKSDSRNAMGAYHQLVRLIRRNHPHLSGLLPSDDDMQSGEKSREPAAGAKIKKIDITDLLGNLGDDGGPLVKQVEARVLGLLDGEADGKPLAYADTSDDADSE